MNNVAAHSRTHIRLSSQAEVIEFIRMITNHPAGFKFSIENFDGTRRIDAGSVIGVMYAMFDFQDEMYLVNETEDGKMPAFIDQFRVV